MPKKTDKRLPLKLPTIRSGFPSPFKSAATAPTGVPLAVIDEAANDGDTEAYVKCTGSLFDGAFPPPRFAALTIAVPFF